MKQNFDIIVYNVNETNTTQTTGQFALQAKNWTIRFARNMIEYSIP